MFPVRSIRVPKNEKRAGLPDLCFRRLRFRNTDSELFDGLDGLKVTDTLGRINFSRAWRSIDQGEHTDDFTSHLTDRTNGFQGGSPASNNVFDDHDAGIRHDAAFHQFLGAVDLFLVPHPETFDRPARPVWEMTAAVVSGMAPASSPPID